MECDPGLPVPAMEEPVLKVAGGDIHGCGSQSADRLPYVSPVVERKAAAPRLSSLDGVDTSVLRPRSTAANCDLTQKPGELLVNARGAILKRTLESEIEIRSNE